MENKTGGITLLSIWSGEKLSKDSCGFPCSPIDEFGGRTCTRVTFRVSVTHLSKTVKDLVCKQSICGRCWIRSVGVPAGCGNSQQSSLLGTDYGTVANHEVSRWGRAVVRVGVGLCRRSLSFD